MQRLEPRAAGAATEARGTGAIARAEGRRRLRSGWRRGGGLEGEGCGGGAGDEVLVTGAAWGAGRRLAEKRRAGCRTKRARDFGFLRRALATTKRTAGSGTGCKTQTLRRQRQRGRVQRAGGREPSLAPAPSSSVAISWVAPPLLEAG